ncbi:hypothetical protein ABZP36_014806 [Zizania latifolia]
MQYHQTAVVPRESILRIEAEWLTSIKAYLVVFDVVPGACRVAADAGIRSVCIGNFRIRTPRCFIIQINDQIETKSLLVDSYTLVLDFDFEKFRSISLSNLNVYACLVCGKYYQGRGLKSHAYTHSLEAGHYVLINLQTEKAYCLPDGIESEKCVIITNHSLSAAKLNEKIEKMFRGDKINNTENISVLHVSLRAPRDSNKQRQGGVTVFRNFLEWIMVVVVLKTFTTAETMLNARTIKEWIISPLGLGPYAVAKHMIAISSGLFKSLRMQNEMKN